MNDRLALSVIGALSAAVVVAVAVLLMGRVPAAGGLDVSGLPRLNAMLNGGSAVLLATGYVFIRRRQIIAHLSCMLGAFVLSTGFLISYVLYHFHAGSRPFTGQGWIRPMYFSLLLTHVVLAAFDEPVDRPPAGHSFYEEHVPWLPALLDPP